MKSGKAAPDQAPSSSEKTLGYFKDIEADKIRQLYKHYKYDFEIFDYSAEEYFELWTRHTMSSYICANRFIQGWDLITLDIRYLQNWNIIR